MSSQDDIICKSCDKICTNIMFKWCRPCAINNLKKNFTNWTSGNEKIDDFIQKMQLKIESYDDIIVEWIPYDQFNNVKKTNKNGFATAIWKDGLLEYNEEEMKRIRISNIEVSLKCLINSQNVINEFSNEAKAYSIKYSKLHKYNLDIMDGIPKIYGISQNPDTNDYIVVLNNSYCKECSEIYIEIWSKWCRPCQINNLELNHSGNKKIDEFIQEMQLKIEKSSDIIVEWIPYNQFNNVKKIGKDGFATAIWKNGPLEYNYNKEKHKYERKSNKKVTLKCLNNSQNVISNLLNEAKTYSIEKYKLDIPEIYGISQNPDTKDYIIILCGFCENCGEIYINIYCQFCKSCYLIQNFAKWTSGNEKIDELIQEMQLKIEKSSDIIVEWIPYNQFYIIKEISKNNFARLYLAIWKDGSLIYNFNKKKGIYERSSNKEVILKCLNNSQSVINDLLNEVKAYPIKRSEYKYDIPKICGISQNPNTSEYIIVFKDGHYCKNCGKIYTKISLEWCKLCHINGLRQNFVNWTSGNEKIDNFIQKTQLKINNYNDTIVEWIPYNQFNNIKEIGKGGFATVYLAIWKDGPLDYQFDDNKHIRTPNREVALKCLHNSQNITNEFLNEVNAYSISNNNGILRIYGISQNPDTNNYIIVLEYANGGNLDNYNNNIIRNHNWIRKLDVLSNIVRGLNIIHENKVVHRDFHTGNILVSFSYNNSDGFTGDSSSHIYISDMGLCGEVSNIDKTKIYGVMPFVAPEVLRGKPYNQAADVYSFGMIMYHIATGRQPFANCAHDSILALNICNGIRPEINEQEAPKFYIDLMKNCWDPDPDKRPSAIEIYELNNLFHSSIFESKDNEIKKQIKKADEYRKANFLSTGNGQSIHPQACYTSRLLNQFTKDLSKDVTDCLDCMIND
ncbi:Mkk2p [Rhizophagus irregularis DAOM 197198w]|uniref:Mkk2p n=2 Tax=Rhizophagus irregularis TaxID=588596 RepID=A0A015JAN4_RHIIW|nr:Mkk2p [Rhizophagus irregularis DAOM 197198w]